MHAKVFSIQIFQYFCQIPLRVCTLVLFIFLVLNIFCKYGNKISYSGSPLSASLNVLLDLIQYACAYTRSTCYMCATCNSMHIAPFIIHRPSSPDHDISSAISTSQRLVVEPFNILFSIYMLSAKYGFGPS